MRELVDLVLMVKNEAHNIIKTLDSCRGIVDHVTVLDTGSTDGTLAVIEAWLTENQIRGTIRERAFVDYGTSRNTALEISASECNSEFSLFLSGDEVLHGGAELRAFLEQHRDASDGAYCVTMRTGTRSWPYTRVLRTDAGWRYHGAIHERPVGPKGEVHGPIVPGVTVVHTPSDPERKAKRLREHDLPLLTKIVEDESKSLEDRAHAIFFLAETHTVLAASCPRDDKGSPVRGGPYLSHVFAAMALYFRYAQIAEQPDNPAYEPQKVAYSLFLHYHLAEPGQANLYSSLELVDRLEVLVQAFPKSVELRWILAKHCASVGAQSTNPDDLKRFATAGQFHALEAAKLQKAVRAKPTFEASDVRMEWLSYGVAVDCARLLGKEDRARDLAKRFVEAGGPKEMFEGLGLL